MRDFEIGKRRRTLVLVVLVVVGVSQIEGCYYMQAIRGQLEVLSDRQPIPEVIADDVAPEVLKARLSIVQDARDFAVERLLLPDNKSYRTYRDLKRDYVVWNVFAAPEFSLNPKTWCFPVAGCVAYRGYFSEESAQKMADKLRADGFDVSVGGVAAYSTLGRFADPVLNTMMRWSDRQLVNTLFHELAHQRLYVKGDTAFNESFATAVANIGSELWQAERGAFAGAGDSRDERALQRDMMALVEAAREKLAALYASSLDDETRRQQKRAILDELSAAGAQLAAARGARNWLAAPLNNARLASLGLYEGRHNAFAALYADCDRKLSCFYREAEDLASLAQAERDRRLDALAARFDAGPGGYSAE